MKTWMTAWREFASPALILAAGAVSGFVAFGDRVDAALKSNAVLYVMAAFDMFRLELLGLVALLLVGPLVVRSVSLGVSATLGILKSERPGTPAHTEVMILITVAALLSGIGGYYGWRYAVGKKLQLSRYETNLGWRVREGLADHRGPQMRTLARIGALVFQDPDSEQLLALIDQRDADVAKLKTLYATLPLGSIGQMDLLAAICDFDFSRAFCHAEIGRLESFVDRRSSDIAREYSRVAASPGEPERRSLDTLCESVASVGNCAMVLADLRAEAGPRPYVDSLQRLGPVRFTDQMMRPTRERVEELRRTAGLPTDDPTPASQ